MRVLVTGATGFIGSRLATRLKALAVDVTATGQINNEVEKKRAQDLKRAAIEVQSGSLNDAQFVRRLCDGQDASIHLAAAQHEANVPDEHFRTVNVGGTRTLLEAASDARIGRFVYGSTIGVYGHAPDGATLDENSPVNPENAYGRSKLEAEAVVKDFAPRLSCCIARISETYGPGDFRLLKLFRAVDRGRFIMLGPGTNQRQLIHVDDLVDALIALSLHPSAGGETFVLAGERVLTTRELVASVASALGRPAPRRALPMWPFVAAATVMEGVLRPLGIQPPLHRRRLDFFRKSFVFSTAKKRALLDLRPPIDLDTGIADTARWYRQQGLLPAEGS